jgi:hypothetical protein
MSASGARITLDSMLRESPPQVNLRWKAEGVLFGVRPRDAAKLVEELNATLDQHGCGHVEVRVYEPPGRHRAAKELAQSGWPQDAQEVWLWGLMTGAVSKLW